LTKARAGCLHTCTCTGRSAPAMLVRPAHTFAASSSPFASVCCRSCAAFSSVSFEGFFFLLPPCCCFPVGGGGW
jgi:hypothetical protein